MNVHDLVLVASASAAMQLPNDANEKVHTMAGPIVALGLALLALTLTVALIAYINSRVPKD